MSSSTKALLEKRLREAQLLKARINQSSKKLGTPSFTEEEIKLLAQQIKKVLKQHLH